MLSQGLPVAGGVVDVGNQVVINGSPLIKPGSRVRVTGPLVLDCGHGLTSPCHETENDPGDRGTKNLEIHPVYSLDILQDFTLPRPSSIDLTGVWAASDVGTYYVRQIGDTIWWLGLSRDQGLTLTSVFRGNLQKGIAVTGLRRGESAPARAAPPGGGAGPPPPLTTLIAGQFASLPLGSTQGDGNLTLTGEFCPNLADGNVPCNTALAATSWNVLNTQTSSSPLFTNGPNGSFAWQKLYDRNTTGAPQIAVPQTMVMGTVANGIDVNISLPVRNIGTAPLIVQSITTSARTLTVSPSTLTIPPGVTELVNVDWLVATNVASGKTEVVSGSIGLRSNDPDSPGVTVTLQVTVRGGPRQ